MSVREVYDNPGNFEVVLKPDTPPDTLKAIEVLDHLVIHAQGIADGHLNRFTDTTLKADARYAGPILEIDFEDQPFTIRGQGMQWHLGDSNGHGPIFAEERAFSAATLQTVIDDFSNGGIIPASLTQGTVTNPASGTYTGTFYPADLSIDAFRTVMKALDCHYRVNPDGTVDAGPTSSNEVYLVDESGGGTLAVAVRNGWGSDPLRVSIEALRTRTQRNALNWVSRVVIADEKYDGSNTIATFKDRVSNPYYDILGNPLVRNRVTSRPSSEVISLSTFLDSELEQANLEEAVDIDLNQWELADGSVAVGDMAFIYDPQSGIFDTANEIQHRGMRIYPKRIRILEADWPLIKGMGVYVRPGGAAITSDDWIDITPYVEWEGIP